MCVIVAIFRATGLSRHEPYQLKPDRRRSDAWALSDLTVLAGDPAGVARRYRRRFDLGGGAHARGIWGDPLDRRLDSR